MARVPNRGGCSRGRRFAWAWDRVRWHSLRLAVHTMARDPGLPDDRLRGHPRRTMPMWTGGDPPRDRRRLGLDVSGLVGGRALLPLPRVREPDPWSCSAWSTWALQVR